MNYDALVESILALHRDSVGRAAAAVNQALVMRNWLIGAYIVEFEQNGSDRAAYGTALLSRLSRDLRRREMKGVSPDLLERMRLVYVRYPQLRDRIPATRSRELPFIVAPRDAVPISATPSRKSAMYEPKPLPTEYLLRLYWSHLVEFIRIDDPWKCAFYENECLRANWSVRELQRQIGSILYERTGLSTDKGAVIAAAREQIAAAPATIADLIRDPYILEFTGLAERSRYRESDLESALLITCRIFCSSSAPASALRLGRNVSPSATSMISSISFSITAACAVTCSSISRSVRLNMATPGR